MKKFSLLLTLVMLVSLFGVASPAPVAADPIEGTYIQIPIIQVSGGWETWIQVQNVGMGPGKFALLLFDYSGPYCGPQCIGLFKIEMSGLVYPGAAWTYKLAEANLIGCDLRPYTPKRPDKSLSGIVLSLSPAQWLALERMTCSSALAAARLLWLNRTMAGQPIAVSVNRIQTGSGGTPRAAAYTGISAQMEGGRDWRTGAYMYYAPQLFDTFSPAGWSSRIWIQNSGNECTSLEVWFQKQQDCLKARIQEVLSLCPGETIAVDPEMPGFLGSAWIRASQPLGVIVDEYNATGSIFMSYRGMPAAIWWDEFTLTYGDLFNFAPLIYREYNGWNAGIVVQNLSSTVNALVKVYFIDNSGDIIDTIVDWICPRGSQTFYLAAINNLPGMYVGQARVESQNWWGPGDPPVAAPTVMSVVNLVNYNTGQGAAYNTFPKWEVIGPDWSWAGKWIALPFLAKDKHDPYEPSGTKWTSEIAMTNLDMIPGVSVWRIDFFDQNGLLYSICQTLNEKQVDYIKLGNIGILPPGWLGSAIISWMCSSLAESPTGDDMTVGHLGVVVVERASGYASGDLTKAYEGFPLWFPPNIPDAVECPECEQLCPSGMIAGTVWFDPLVGEPYALGGVPVELLSAGHDNLFGTADDWWAWTLTWNDGDYAFTNLPAGTRYIVSVAYDGDSATRTVYLDCDDDLAVDFTLVEPEPACLGDVEGTAEISGGAHIVGATVELWAADAFVDVTLTDAEGNFEFANVDCDDYHLKIIFLCEQNFVSVDSPEFTVEDGDLDVLDVVADLEACTAEWIP